MNKTAIEKIRRVLPQTPFGYFPGFCASSGHRRYKEEK